MCVWVANEIDYLRHFIDESGAMPDKNSDDARDCS